MKTDHRSSRSPWMHVNYPDRVEITPPPGPIDLELSVPGSKSFSNRALVIAGLARGRSVLSGILRSDDTYWVTETLSRLGLEVDVTPDTITVTGGGGAWPRTRGELFVGSAGTGARFLPGALAVAPRGEWTLDGSDQLRRRPVAPLLDALRTLGANFDALGEEGSLPIRVRASGLKGGRVTISGSVSSQFISGVLIAAPYAQSEVEVEVVGDFVQPDYVGMTIQMMQAFGVDVEHTPDYRRMLVRPQAYEARSLAVEADASTACYFLALPALHPGRVRVTNVGASSLQPDAKFVDVLERMGLAVRRGDGYLETQSTGRLRGNLTVDMRPMSDQTLTLGALAPFADGPVTVTNVEHIRRHESDRIAVLCRSLGQLGIRVDERPDGFTVYPGVPRPAVLDPHDDHRNAMAFALIGSRTPGLVITNPSCVSKTCPEFFELLGRTGVGVAGAAR